MYTVHARSTIRPCVSLRTQAMIATTLERSHELARRQHAFESKRKVYAAQVQSGTYAGGGGQDD